MGAKSNTCYTRTSRWWAQGTGGQRRLWIPTAGRIHFIWIVCRTGHGIISTRHPASPSFQILKSTQITFWLIWKISFGKDLINLWKTTQALTYSRIIKKELNAYMHMCAHTHTHTHTHISHTHPQTMQWAPRLWTTQNGLWSSISWSFTQVIYGCKKARLGQKLPKFFFLSTSAVYQLLAFSIWSGSN